MKASELRDLSLDELRSKAGEMGEEVFNLQFQHATGQLENPMRLVGAKKNIARVKTVIREKELALFEETSDE